MDLSSLCFPFMHVKIFIFVDNKKVYYLVKEVYYFNLIKFDFILS